MRYHLERIHDEAFLLQPQPAVLAFIDVVAKRGDAEAGFAIDQEVDLVGEEVSVVHGICTLYAW